MVERDVFCDWLCLGKSAYCCAV